MELIVEAYNLEHALYCIEKGVDNIIIGNEIFANQFSYSFSENEIIKIVNNKKNTKIWVKVDVFFFEQEINRLICYLKWLSRINIDFVIFQDFAVATINDEYNLNLKLHYSSQTLTVSYYQFPFFLESKINSVFIAREVTKLELEEIAKNKQDMKIMIQGHGFGFIMQSRWNMISNFKRYFNEEINSDQILKIVEEQRKYPNLIFENRHGTFMLTGYQIYTINLLKWLNNIEVDYIMLDFFNTTIEYAKNVTDLYIEAKNNLNNLDKYEKQLFFLHKNSDEINNGFLGNIKNLPHLQKKGENE